MPASFLNSALGAALLLILAGLANTCVHAPEPIPVPTEEVPDETMTAPNMELIKEPLAPAVHSLLRKSQTALEQRQLEEAEAHAERAYRMEGRDYRVLFMRARVSLAQGDANDAEQWAQRALGSLPAKYKEHRRQTWEFIARARASRGDDAGRDAALQEARSIR
jgi:predicted Zn-dependent protease